MGTAADYGAREVEAAKRVLIELMQILGEYREQMVLIGGWVPFFLIGEGHVGSTDIDLALNHDQITDEVYETIQGHLEQHGYIQGKQPFMFTKEVTINDAGSIVVELDLLSGEYGGTGRSHRHQKIQDVKLRKARGCELAFEYNTCIKVAGKMPDGAENEVQVNLSDVVPFIVMKGMALYDRMKEKDAWDIFYCIRHFPGGIESLADAFSPILEHGLVQEGLAKIRSKFMSPDHIGPAFVADFDEISDRDERALRKRDAYERVNALLDVLGVQVYE